MNPAPVKPSVALALLQQLDIRVGTILAVEDVPKSKKLVRLRVDFGDHQLFVVNLEPKPVMGEVSEGMLLDLGFDDGIVPVLAVPETPVPNGTRAG